MKIDISRVEAEILLYALNYLEASDLVDRPKHGSFMDGKQMITSDLSNYVVRKIQGSKHSD